MSDIDDHDRVADLFAAFKIAGTAVVSAEETADGCKRGPQSDSLTCPHCDDATHVRLEDGNYICGQCNTLLQRFLDHSAEWRYYGNDDGRTTDPARCGPPVNELMPMLGSVLTANGSARTSLGTRMIRKYQSWHALKHSGRSLYQVCDLLTVCASLNGIAPSILEEAKRNYNKAAKKKIYRGPMRVALIASCMYMACKTEGAPRSIREIAEMFDADDKKMTCACKDIEDVLTMPVPASSALNYINRFCSKLGAEEGFTALCHRVVDAALALDVVSEYAPPSVVAGAIMLCADIRKDKRITKKLVAQCCGVSIVTVSKSYKTICQFRKALLEGKPSL